MNWDTPKPKPIHSNQNLRTAYEHIWRISEYIDLPRNFICPPTDLFKLLDNRRSRRIFIEITDQDLSSLLWFTQRHTGIFSNQSDRVTTPIPTFGGLASVRTIVVQPNLTSWIYDPINHRAGIIDSSAEIKNNIRRDGMQFFNIANGSVLLFAASKQFVSEYYNDPNSLVLREAGILMGILALVSEALNLSFCPLGTPGTEWIFSLLNTNEEVIIPAGAAIIGGRQSTSMC
jgi:hypothetical protein